MAKTKAEKEMMIVKESEPHQVVQFDCLAVTNVNVFPFQRRAHFRKNKSDCFCCLK